MLKRRGRTYLRHHRGKIAALALFEGDSSAGAKK